MAGTKKIKIGDRVRDLKWNGRFTGTVVRTSMRNGAQVVFVQWDSLAVEDELPSGAVEALGERITGEPQSIIKKVEFKKARRFYESK